MRLNLPDVARGILKAVIVSLALLIGGGALMLLPGLSVVNGKRRRH